jgi:hypothetical protein
VYLLDISYEIIYLTKEIRINTPKEAFMINKYIDTFQNIRKSIYDIVCDKDIADKIIQYDIYSNVFSCFKESGDSAGKIKLKEYIERILDSLFNDINASELFDKDIWMNFWNDNEEYRAFQEKYNLPYNMVIADVGTEWLGILDRMDDYDMTAKICCFEKLLDYLVWSNTFCYVYAYQYYETNWEDVRFEESRVSRMQYYEYRELKTYIDKISGYELKEQMDRLVRQYCVSEFDYMYPDRETMWLDMIKRGLAIPEAMKIVKQVCRGCGLSDLMKSKLRNIGYKEEIINEMNECKYLKGRNVGLMKLLYVQNLVGGVV